MWLTLPTNKIVATMFTNDPDGIAATDKEHGLPATVQVKGLSTSTNLASIRRCRDDFSSQIAELKKANADIVCGIFNPPQFATFWTQCAQQGYQPKIVTPPKALLFPTAVEALGDRGVGMSTEVWWSHHHPFKSGLTGETAQQFATPTRRRPASSGPSRSASSTPTSKWRSTCSSAPRSSTPTAIRDAIAETDYQSIVGPITWKGGPPNPVPNVCITPLVGGQWKKGKKFKYDLEHRLQQDGARTSRSTARSRRLSIPELLPGG